jgi:hypothetical protein
MKSQPVLFLLLVVCFSCGTNDKPLSEPQKEKVINEVKPVVAEILKGAQEANIDLITASAWDSPDYTFVNNGKAYSFKELIDGFKPLLTTLSNQKCNITSEKYAVLDKTTVIYTLVASWEMNFKDGHSVVQQPWVTQFTFKKINGKWKAVGGLDSGYERVDKVSKEPKELNQAELAKQFIGTWKSEVNDTILIYDQRPYGNLGQEVTFKITAKGKPVAEGKQLVSYDNKLDRIVVTNVTRDADMWVGSLQFDSKNKVSFVFGQDIYHPESAVIRVEGEFLSPDMYVEKQYKEDKLISTYTYTKIK